MRDTERFRDENYQEERAHGPMESAVGIGMSYRFGYRFLQQNLFTEPQWQALREILERYFGMGDIDTALRYEVERMHDDLPRNPGLDTYQFDIDDKARREQAKEDDEKEDDPFDDGKDFDLSFGESRPPRGARFPAGVLSVLEAAYEHQDDTRAMLRLSMYAILSDVPPADRYLPMAKDLATDDWPNVLAHIMELFGQYGDELFPFSRNRMVERLIIQERLSDHAWQYLQSRRHIDESDAVFFGAREPQWQSMFDELAPVAMRTHAAEIADELVRPLQDADKNPLRDDTGENRIIIANILKCCIDFGERDLAERQRERLRLMYPKRRMLQRMLDAVMDGSFNQFDPRWECD